MPDYVELHAHSNFSLLDGASHPEDLARCAAELGMPALALTDHDAVYGAVRFIQAAKAHGIRPILGAEITLDGGYHLSVLVKDEAGWHNLCVLISAARHNATKGEAMLPPKSLEGHTDGLIALTGCRDGEIAQALLRGDRKTALSAGLRYRDLFGLENLYVEMQHHLLPDSEDMLAELSRLAIQLGVRAVATNNVHYPTRHGHRLQDILVCIRHLTTLDDSMALRRPNSEYYLKPSAEMATLFTRYPDALANTARIAERCQFELRYGLQDLPHFATPPGISAEAYIQRLCQQAARRRYRPMPERVERQMAHELRIIQEAGLSNYFLIIWDIVRYARAQGILCQGRGSAANSLVAYLLGITPIDPLAHDLVFERFLSKERTMAPDVDIDFQADRREEVIQYVYQRYGTDHAAMACTLITFRARSAIRDVGRALGLSADVLDQAAKSPDLRTLISDPTSAEGELWQQMLTYCQAIDGFPRHLGIHNGGMILTGPPLAHRVPTEPATMPDRVVVQWDKDALEAIGLVKIDILGLRMLSSISDAVALVVAKTGKQVDLGRLDLHDPSIYQMISRADTIGIFQVESRAQAQVLPRLQPRHFGDIIISISLIRPGPIQGNMVHPYLRRRKGLDPVTYPHPLLKPALQETLGVILFQEQVLKVARDLAGFAPGQAELLRRALGSKRSYEMIERLRTEFILGALSQGVSQEVAQEVFERLKAFGGYSFPKSHAAAFAILVYQSAWLKRYHPEALYVALLNHQPMGFWSPGAIINDAKRHGIDVLPMDIHRSEAKCTLETGTIRLGLTYLNGLGESGIQRILDARQRGPFRDLVDLCRRTRLPRSVIEDLIMVGAMDCWGIPRRKLIWRLGTLRYREEELDLRYPDEGVALAPITRAEAMAAEYGILGLSTGDHVMALYRDRLREQGILSSGELEGCRQGERVTVAGLVVVHQAPPTAKGMRFITLEDEEGLMNIVVRPDVHQEHRDTLIHSPLLVIEGVVQRQGAVVNVQATGASAVPRGIEMEESKMRPHLFR